MRKKRLPQSYKLRDYPYRATMQIDYWRTLREQESVSAAATSISGGDYESSSSFAIESQVTWHFRSADQAHAMQVWLSGHVRPYDQWVDRQRSYEDSRRRTKQIADLVNAAAATGARDRVLAAYRAGRTEAAVEKLREIEPQFDVPRAKEALAHMQHSLLPY